MEKVNERNNKTICLPFNSKEYYQSCIEDTEAFRQFLVSSYAQYPEIFPSDFTMSFKFNGFVSSKKQDGFLMRRIKLKNRNEDCYQIRPSFMMPYQIAETKEVDKALYLRHWGVPFDALAYVFGRDAMFWYRAYLSQGRNSIVGATVKKAEFLPEHVLADEKHTRLKGDKVYIASTAAQGLLLGSALTSAANIEALAEAYKDFKEEAQNIAPEYQPKTVNTDGWEATQKAWKKLFPTVVTILCFLHAFLKIRDRCKRSKELLKEIGEKVWNVYCAETLSKFSQRMRRLKDWAKSHLTEGAVKDKVLSLCEKSSEFKPAFAYPEAYRTSNQIDRLMDYQDRVLYSIKYFHGTSISANLYVRSMALAWNFHPYGSKTLSQDPNRSSPFNDLNGFCYHENWLENMLVASSMGGWRR